MGLLKTDDYDLEAIARQFGTPLFIFSGDAIRERVDEFRAAFGAEWPRFELMPSLKACPIPVSYTHLTLPTTPYV